MSSKPTHEPQLGALIDDNTLKLVEILGTGGYGVVYRGVDTCSPQPKSYAVKCLLHSYLQSTKRQVQIREIALHQISSAHPGVITLHRVVEEGDHIYLIMDYAPDSDLFTQILNHRRYVGDDALIKHVFLQLLDAVEYCHSLGIYHRDLKPENVLCFDDGCRVAITDFGLATTEKVSKELRTGSIYHMSPGKCIAIPVSSQVISNTRAECQGGAFAPDGTYGPMSNDVWSLGIILLNLATGRNLWKTATPDDPMFQAYLYDPLGFFPSVLPVSSEINEILVRMLHIDSGERITLSELREALEDVQVLYSEDVVFEGSIAKCPWEAGLDIESDPSIHQDGLDRSDGGLKSAWSKNSGSHSSSEPRTPDGPGNTTFSAYDVTKAANHKFSSYPYSPSSSIPYSDQEVWTTLQPSRDFGMGEVLDTPPQHVEAVASGSSSLDEAFFPVVTSLRTSFCTSNDGGLGEQAGEAHSLTWNPKTHENFSRSSSQSTSSSEQSCSISFARSSTPSSDTSWSRDSQSACPLGASVYTLREFHDSGATIFSQFKFFRRSDTPPPPLALGYQHDAALSVYRRESSPTTIHTCFGPNSTPPDASLLGRTFNFGSKRRWFFPGKLFAFSTAAK